MRISFCLLAGAAALSVAGFAQPVTAPEGTIHGGTRFSARTSAGPVVTGAPYSAQRVTEHVMVAADGTRFTTSNRIETLYRDSSGRTRTERTVIAAPNVADAPLLVEINDPVNNVGYTLDTQNKVAHRMVFGAPPSGAAGMFRVGGGGGAGGGARQPLPNAVSGEFAMSLPAPAAASGQPQPEIRQEDLGRQAIEGVTAQGRRMTHVWPAGSQGNDRPFETVSETWYSPDLKLTVLNKTSDPRYGESTVKLVNIDRSEPSPALFQPPPDYRVVDETGSFEIQWTARRP